MLPFALGSFGSFSKLPDVILRVVQVLATEVKRVDDEVGMVEYGRPLRCRRDA
jgi:hypothetical protein